MAETRKERYEREKQATAYREFIEEATRHVASEVIRTGFSNMRGALEMVIRMYEHYKKENP
jgi:hypothetical protein